MIISCDELIKFRLLFTFREHEQKLNQTSLMRNNYNSFRSSNMLHSHKNEHHWFSHVKQTCLSFCLLQLMCELINVFMQIKT